ncbi:MAG: hypothetical protein AB7L92_03990 [Alphaproteobacteria bacterium]
MTRIRHRKQQLSDFDKEKHRVFNQLVSERTMQTTEYGRAILTGVAIAVAAFILPIATAWPLLTFGTAFAVGNVLSGMGRNKKINESKSQIEGIFRAEHAISEDIQHGMTISVAEQPQPDHKSFADRVSESRQSPSLQR